MSTPTKYEAPRLDRLGLVSDLTEAGGHTNADNPLGNNDAYSNYVAPK